MPKWLLPLCLVLISGCSKFNEVDKTRFEITPQTVLDTKSKLMWAPSDNRQSLPWQKAVSYCENYNGGGYDDWRMPKRSELKTLIEAEIKNNGEIINITSNLIWASDTDDTKAAFCHLGNRSCSWMEQVISVSFRALPVRDLKVTTDTTQAPVTNRPQSAQKRLQVLDLLYKQQLITEDEYTQKKAIILDEI
jgi:hypothetical protein